ncbi:MAG: LysR family transcriptional regulator [Rhodospirillaceae bacterium]|jgi:DNA-binding transcriptional LysR family regulator|nr:LysR family transcriptional regulator [Rhodospirillaceae bacterium]
MVRRFYKLPSLNALGAFEAAARHSSLSFAANELNVTPSAVSKHVTFLEQELGVPLFVRGHRSMRLTPEGEQLYRSLSESFAGMAAAFEAIRTSRTARTVTIGCTTAFAQLWLMPRLGNFWRAHQDIIIDQVVSDRSQDLRRSEVDLRIRYGDGKWPEETAIKLFGDCIFPVASPDFARRHKIKEPAELLQLPLLEVVSQERGWTSWEEFFTAINVPARRLKTRRINNYIVCWQAAMDGQGVALGWQTNVADLMAQKKLVQLGKTQVVPSEATYVTWSAHRPLSAEATVMRDWLMAEAASVAAQLG